jgi:hypothetical protein
MIDRGVCNKSYSTSATSGAGTAYRPGAPEFTLGFKWVSVHVYYCYFIPVSRDTVIKKERGGDPIDRFHTATLLYLSQAETLISTSYVIFVF